MILKSKYKYVLQKKDYDCGVAATATLLINSGMKKINYTKLSLGLSVTEAGVPPSNIAQYLMNITDLLPKLKVGSSISDLKSELKDGRLCMVMYQSWGEPDEIKALECGHYSVAVGVYRNKIYLLDPTAYEDWGDGVGWRIMDLKEFKNSWVDKDHEKIIKGWMLSVAPVENI